MKKMFTLLCAMLLAVQFTSAQTLFVLSKSGGLAAYPADKVYFGDDLFTFTYGEVSEVTEETFSVPVCFASKSYKFRRYSSYGICLSDVNPTPTISDGACSVERSDLSAPENMDFKVDGLDAGTTYYYRAYVKVGYSYSNAIFYGEVRSVTTSGKKPDYTIINGHKFVDLGLPSGLLWATCNIGASWPTSNGDYFAWGEAQSKSYYNFDWSLYKYGTSNLDEDLTKYNSTDGKTELDKDDDAAYVKWGASCRMPTNDDFIELCDSNNCVWTWTTKPTLSGYSVSGFKVTSVKNGNSIFLPTTGLWDGKDCLDYRTCGYYWSSTLSWRIGGTACCLDFSPSKYFLNFGTRCLGRVIRPVAEP